MWGRLIIVAALAVTVLGCGGANKNKYLRKQASTDLTCSEGQIRLTTMSKSDAQFLAEGCGRRAVYTYAKGTGAVRVSQIEGANVGASDATPPAGPPPPPPPAP